MGFRFIILATLLVFFATGNAQIDTTLADYFPMHIGDFWEYEIEGFPPEYYQVRITGDTLMPNGKSYFVFKYSGNYTSYLRMDDSLRVFIYGGATLPDSCDQENLVYDLSLPDSTLFIECFREYPEGNFPALLSTFDWYYPYLGLNLPTKKFWGAYVDSVTNDTLWTSIFYTENWLAKGIGRAFSQPEAGSPERLVGAIIDSIQYGYVNSINIEKETILPHDEVILYPNYPNPFNPNTTIRFVLSRSNRITLTIYDVNGKEVMRPVDNQTLHAGDYEASWDGKTSDGNVAACGIYFYKLTVGTQGVVQRMLLIR